MDAVLKDIGQVDSISVDVASQWLGKIEADILDTKVLVHATGTSCV